MRRLVLQQGKFLFQQGHFVRQHRSWIENDFFSLGQARDDFSRDVVRFAELNFVSREVRIVFLHPGKVTAAAFDARLDRRLQPGLTCWPAAAILVLSVFINTAAISEARADDDDDAAPAVAERKFVLSEQQFDVRCMLAAPAQQH